MEMTSVAASLGGVGGLAAVLLVLAVMFAPGRAYAEDLKWDVGEWQACFDPASSRLDLMHSATGAAVCGALSFEAERDGAWQAWSVVPARDSVASRLALLDQGGNVQGYLTFTGAGGVLRVTPVHRAAQNYAGRLTLRATATVGTQTLACRTRAVPGSRVVQMASGHADSALNDSLFDMTTDTALRFSGGDIAITYQGGHETKAAHEVVVACAPHEPANAALEVEIIRDYYRARYVPYYKPINKARCPSPPTGWMSWNVYFDTAGEAENLAEARVAAEHLKPFGLEIWHIESWQDNSPKLPVSNFHNLTLRPFAEQFPHGMKWLADEIRKTGFKPGIWTVPFGTGDTAYYQAHRDWFLHNSDGSPMRNWCGRYVLDPSQEAVQQHMEDTHRAMSEEWGYEYFKIDGMSGRSSSYSAHFYERDDVRAAFREPCDDPFKLCVEALRRGIGPDRIWLACQGHYTGPEVGLADAGRLGADIVHAKHPPQWNNYLNQARTTLNQLFVNNIVWYGDPDTLLVGTANPDTVVRLAATVVGLPGQMMFAGDKLAELPPERMRLLQQCLPVCDVQPRDLFPIFEMPPVWDLKICRPFGQWDVVSLFNWSDKAEDIDLRFDAVGLDSGSEYLVYDFWNQTFRGVHREGFSASVPPHGNVLLAVHPALGRPQFLSTDRHITQGGVSLEDVRWDGEQRVLTGSVTLVGGYSSALTFHLPEGYALASATSDDARVEEVREDGARVITVVLRREESGRGQWRLTF
jgi:Alpha galactosidase C-terminal beta sandwich domain/Melibiase